MLNITKKPPVFFQNAYSFLQPSRVLFLSGTALRNIILEYNGLVLDRSLIKTFEISIETGRKVKLIYDDGNRITERTVKALKIEDKKMICYCYLRKKKRSFVLEKILSAELCD